MPSFKCKDVGMKCGFEIKDESEKEMMQMINEHALQTHGIKEPSPDLQERIKKAVKK